MSDELRAELAIRDLIARYSDAVARRDEAAWAATWAPDGEWKLLGQVRRGREDVVAFWGQLMATVPWVVQVPSFALLSLDGASATGRCTVTEYGKTPDGSGTLTLGVYHDRCVELDGEWMFARRHLDVLYMGPPDLSGAALPFPQSADPGE